MKDIGELTDPGDKAVAERRRFVKELEEGVARTKESQEAEKVQQLWRAMQERRKLNYVQKQELQLESQTFRDRLRNIGKGVLDFLSQPTREARRVKAVEQQSLEAYIDMFKNAGKRSRGAAGFLKGVGAAMFGGIGKASTEMAKKLEPKPAQAKAGPNFPNPKTY